MGIDVFNDLNTEIIIGNPGCGKTTTLVKKVQKLIKEGVPPAHIAYFSFSVAAVEEAINRTIAVCELDRDDFPFFRTIHSMAFALLGLNTQQVMQGYHLIDFGKERGLKLSIQSMQRNKRGLYPSRPDDKLIEVINVSRLLDMSVRDYMVKNNIEFADITQVEELAVAYDRYKKSKGVYDYTDMLILANKSMITIPKFEYMIIDEAQDLSTMQWLIVEKLAEKTKHIIIAGDDKQTINEFAGADLDYFLSIKAKVTVLKQSYRVPTKVFNMANKLVTKMKKKRPSTWVPRDADGEVERVKNLPLQALRNGSWLILARTNAQLQSLKQKMIGNLGIICPLFLINDECPIDRDVFKAIELFKVISNQKNTAVVGKFSMLTIDPDHDDLALRKRKITYIQLFKKFIMSTNPSSVELDDHFVEQFCKDQWFDAFDKIPLDERLYIARVLPHYLKDNDLFKRARIRLCTIHGAKGSEADNVLLYTAVPPQQQKKIREQDEGEVRLLYVAVTRTKENLYLMSNGQNKLSYEDLLG